MNFFLSLFRSKLDNLRAAAPRASIRLLHESNGFSAYLDETAAVRKVTQLGTLEDKSEEIFIDAPVLTLFVPLDQMVRFMDEVTAHHSVALVDVLLPTKEDKARYVMYAYFPRRSKVSTASGSWAGEWDYSDACRALSYSKPTQEKYDHMVGRCNRMTQSKIDQESLKAAPVAKKPNFWD